MHSTLQTVEIQSKIAALLKTIIKIIDWIRNAEQIHVGSLLIMNVFQEKIVDEILVEFLKGLLREREQFLVGQLYYWHWYRPAEQLYSCWPPISLSYGEPIAAWFSWMMPIASPVNNSSIPLVFVKTTSSANPTISASPGSSNFNTLSYTMFHNVGRVVTLWHTHQRD